jgi:hypothetical protein
LKNIKSCDAMHHSFFFATAIVCRTPDVSAVSNHSSPCVPTQLKPGACDGLKIAATLRVADRFVIPVMQSATRSVAARIKPVRYS